jgi:hypothetical protein
LPKRVATRLAASASAHDIVPFPRPKIFGGEALTRDRLQVRVDRIGRRDRERPDAREFVAVGDRLPGGVDVAKPAADLESADPRLVVGYVAHARFAGRLDRFGDGHAAVVPG